MATEIDSLEIKLQANAQSANRSITALIDKLNVLSSTLGRVSGANLNSLSTGVTRLSTAMQGMKAVGTADFTRLAKNLEKIATINYSQVDATAAAINRLSNSLGSLGNVKMGDGVAQLTNLATAISKLGYKTAGQAVINIPLLANAMSRLMTTLSTAPQVSQNLIDMTNALANLSATGSASGRVVNSLTNPMTRYSKSANQAAKSSFSLASAIGKVYATYFLLFRGFSKIKDAIDISSSITEVQNVVDKTFGNYASKVQDLVNGSIENYGMSELTVKQVSSRFQAMGMAMGFAQDKMSDLSINLTKLTADMASFYNVEQKDVAEDLAAIFTGQTRPLRTYGLDLTEANLKQWALTQGMQVNIDTMTGAEKAMLRYEYVMSQTERIQGDFIDTQSTWANQTRILHENFKDLGKTIGNIGINVFKPLVQWVNLGVQAFNNFAKTVSDSLGQIFGWEYEASSGAIIDVGDAFDDVADGIGDADSAAKKLKKTLLSFDELNVISDTSSSSVGDSIADNLINDYNSGGWKKTDGLLEKYFSDLDSLNKLGTFVSDKITSSLQGINWDSIYDNAGDFGSGLASYLNGSITPEKFGEIGGTIAKTINTVAIAAFSFTDTLDGYEVGKSIAEFFNRLFSDISTDDIAHGINSFCGTIKDSIKGFFENIKVSEIFGTLIDLVSKLNIDTIDVVIGAFLFKQGGELLTGMLFSSKLAKALGIAVNGKAFFFTVAATLALRWGIENIINNKDSKYRKWVKESQDKAAESGSLTQEQIKETDEALDNFSFWDIFSWDNIKKNFEEVKSGWGSLFDFGSSKGKEVGEHITEGVGEGMKEQAPKTAEESSDNLFQQIWKYGTAAFGIHSPAKKMYPIGEYIVQGIGVGFENELPKLKVTVTESFNTIIDGLKSVWNNFAKWLDNVTSTINSKSSLGGAMISGAISIPKFASGGFPEDGLFMANHNELVGGFSNGRTAVANNTQIEYGIAYGVRQAVDEALGPYLAEIARNTRETADKDMTVSIGDRDIARANTRGQRSMGRKLVTIS